jgi:hypothetical protein
MYAARLHKKILRFRAISFLFENFMSSAQEIPGGPVGKIIWVRGKSSLDIVLKG